MILSDLHQISSIQQTGSDTAYEEEVKHPAQVYSPAIRNSIGHQNNVYESSARRADFTQEANKITLKSMQLPPSNHPVSRQQAAQDNFTSMTMTQPDNVQRSSNGMRP